MPARLGSDPRHFETAERMPSDDRSGASSVDVEVPDPERFSRPVDVGRASAEHGARQGIGSAIGHIQRLFKGGHLDDTQHGTKNLFLGQAVVGLNVCKDDERHKMAVFIPNGRSTSTFPSVLPISM